MNGASDSQLASIEIRPEVTVLSVLRHLNYKAWFAIAEFIDNALQSAIANGEQLKALYGGNFQLTVDVQLDTTGPGQIVITDNAAGISKNDFPRAFRAAQIPNRPKRTLRVWHGDEECCMLVRRDMECANQGHH